jgi:molybdopterin molybdotransferase
MISVEEAKQLIKSNIVANKKIIISLANAVNYNLSKDIIATINMPPFRQSAMDGYALRLQNSDTYSVIDEVKAGDSHIPILNNGEAIRIFTGAAVPDTANAVIMQEKVVIENGKLKLQKIVISEENIRPMGEQVKIGDIALKEGTKLTPAAIGYLASLGVTEVEVFKKPRIAIVATGNELTTPGIPLEHGKIYESNSIMLASALSSLDYTNVSIHKVEDDYINTKNLLNTIINENDLVLITGGISVGDYDFVGKALEELAVEEVFYKVKQKPGKPLFFGKKETSRVFALPGNPAAALSCFYIYAYPALQKMSGAINYHLIESKANSTSTFVKKGDRAQFLKAHITNNNVEILEGQSSAMLQTFALANAFVYVSEEQPSIAIGDNVQVIHFPK